MTGMRGAGRVQPTIRTQEPTLIQARRGTPHHARTPRAAARLPDLPEANQLGKSGRAAAEGGERSEGTVGDRPRAHAHAGRHGGRRHATAHSSSPAAHESARRRVHSPAAQHHLVLADETVPVAAAPAAAGRGGRREAVAADGGHGVARAARSACTHQVREPGPYVCGCVPWMPGPGMLVRAADAGGAGKGGEGLAAARRRQPPADGRGGSAL